MQYKAKGGGRRRGKGGRGRGESVGDRILEHSRTSKEG